jgi:bifunctional ADP-heptose synthase (sugar kinase/adenylyltransferase)
VFTNGVSTSFTAMSRTDRVSARRRTAGRRNRTPGKALAKGPSAPAQSVRRSRRCHRSAASVDLAVGFDEDTPLALVLECRPDIIVKGGDYTVGTTVGAAEVIGWGGRFEAIPLLQGRSTSELVRRIRESG